MPRNPLVQVDQVGPLTFDEPLAILVLYQNAEFLLVRVHSPVFDQVLLGKHDAIIDSITLNCNLVHI